MIRRTVMISIVAGWSIVALPALGGIGTGDSGIATIDTRPPLVTVDQFPPFTVFQGGDTIHFHWQTSDSHPGTIPQHFTATVWIDGEAGSSFVYYPGIDDAVWDWVVPETISAKAHLVVQARDAFGNLSSGFSNSFTLLSSVTAVPGAPAGLILDAPAPNPFNPSTRLHFNLPEPGRVTLTVHDVRGRLVRTLVRDSRQAGDFETRWNGRDEEDRALPGGIYLFVLEFHGSVKSGRLTRKSVLIP